MGRPDLFVGVTSWNSALFLGRCLRSIQQTSSGLRTHVLVWDNESSDDSVEVARSLDVQVRVQRCNQPDALNALLAASDAPVSLLLHSDVVLLSPRWFEVCRSHLGGDTALVSPEDIGCGPCSRPFGSGMPESSFLLFDTHKLRDTKVTYWRRWHRLPYPHRVVDFYGPHVTHRLPQRLRARGYSWHPMNVLVSDRCEQPIYQPSFSAAVWSDELAYLRYGLGNFYSLDGEITHYHNWYDRVPKTVPEDSTATTGANGSGFPAAYVRKYTENFLRDYDAGKLVLPDPSMPRRAPIAL